jgi:glutamate/tyrosine decarboxylase-like PLP-dependent enzyme
VYLPAENGERLRSEITDAGHPQGRTAGIEHAGERSHFEEAEVEDRLEEAAGAIEIGGREEGHQRSVSQHGSILSRMDSQRWIREAVDAHAAWMSTFGNFEAHPAAGVADDRLKGPFAEFTERLRDNYPYGHPRYAAQMLKPPHPVAVVGYVAAMLVNPNNHALDGGPATAQMEKEVVAELARMFGFTAVAAEAGGDVGSPGYLGHLTSSGTIANLEALYVARETNPGRGVAHSADAHYTHARMCHVLGIPSQAVPTDAAGRMDIGALDELLAGGTIGTVVATAGTTGLGAVDPIHEIVTVARRHGVRVHVDAAYGGFFTLLAGDEPASDGGGGANLDPRPWRAIAECDSVVVDPHKHGLQPYGCGAVIFRDPAVGRFYAHDSPYTYFTSDELHLGQISLECSRAGASAAALWLTLQLFPLTADCLGSVLRPGRRAALRWADLITESEQLELYQRPDLDIVTYFPNTEGHASGGSRGAQTTLSAVDAASAAVMDAGMADASVFLATYAVDGAAMHARGHDLVADVDAGRILRSVLMKPEMELVVDQLHDTVCELVDRVGANDGLSGSRNSGRSAHAPDDRDGDRE